MKYVIYEYEEGIKQLFEKYPNLKQYFDNLTLDNDFMNKFINCVYNSVDYMNELIYKELHNLQSKQIQQTPSTDSYRSSTYSRKRR